jgi:hypothetical protein
MNQQPQTKGDVAYEQALLERLRELYLQRVPFPPESETVLTINDFYRFYRYIKAEGYGQ